MRRVRRSVVAFSTSAAAIMSVIVADPCVRPARAQAEDWPTRPLTLVVPFSAGGSSDTIGRIVADGISSDLRQPVIVENVAGAGGMVGGNLQQFIAYTKANQAKLHYSSSGAGGSNHLACMLLNSTIGIEVTHVPYRNVVQGLQEVMAGRVDYDCVSLPLGLPQIAGKTVKPIAILS